MIPALTTVFFAIFSSDQVQTVGEPVAAFHPTSICEVKARSNDLVGRKIHLSARYNSDRRHFSLLIDDHCGEPGNILQVGRNNSQSATALWTAWEKQCELAGDAGLCIVSEHVNVVGEIRQSDDGLVVDILSMRKTIDKRSGTGSPENRE